MSEGNESGAGGFRRRWRRLLAPGGVGAAAGAGGVAHAAGAPPLAPPPPGPPPPVAPTPTGVAAGQAYAPVTSDELAAQADPTRAGGGQFHAVSGDEAFRAGGPTAAPGAYRAVLGTCHECGQPADNICPHCGQPTCANCL